MRCLEEVYHLLHARLLGVCDDLTAHFNLTYQKEGSSSFIWSIRYWVSLEVRGAHSSS